MKRERGFELLQIAAILVAAAAAIGAITMLVHTVTTFIENTGRDGYNRGVAATESAYKGRDNAKLLAAQATIARLQAEKDAAEKKAKLDLAAEAAKRRKELDDEKAKGDAFIACLLAGTCELRDPGSGEARGRGAGGGGSSTAVAAAAAAPGDATSGCALSGRTAADLYGEAGRADQIRTSLLLCQATVRVYYRACTGDELPAP